MERDYRFDIARVVCMTFIVAFLHLYGYIYDAISANVIPWCCCLCDSCLGLFTFISGYLLGKKYDFNPGRSKIKDFYLNRVVRIIPLFLLASLALWLIGFNSGKATLCGILCISPFVTASPMTLWYVPVIIICYLVTPLVCRRDFKWRIISSLCIMLFVMVGGMMIDVDYRFKFNLFFYLVGLASAPYITWKLSSKTGIVVKLLVVSTFISSLAFCQEIPNYLRLASSMLGVFAVLFVCEVITIIVFLQKTDYNEASGKGLIKNTVKYVSYASMACYMFHRLFYWFGELLWNPASPTIKWVYMAGVVSRL